MIVNKYNFDEWLAIKLKTWSPEFTSMKWFDMLPKSTQEYLKGEKRTLIWVEYYNIVQILIKLDMDGK